MFGRKDGHHYRIGNYKKLKSNKLATTSFYLLYYTDTNVNVNLPIYQLFCQSKFTWGYCANDLANDL